MELYIVIEKKRKKGGVQPTPNDVNFSNNWLA